MKTKIVYKGNVKESIFKQIRTRANMSQQDFARLLGVTVTTMSRWEQGKHEPTLTIKQIKVLSILLSGLGLKITDLPDGSFGEVPYVVAK